MTGSALRVTALFCACRVLVGLTSPMCVPDVCVPDLLTIC